MKRGDLVTISAPGDYGKPRPALVIQADHFSEIGSLTVLPITGTLVDAPLLRIDIAANATSNLEKPSQIMLDKIITVRRDKVGAAFGRLDPRTWAEVERGLVLFLGIGG